GPGGVGAVRRLPHHRAAGSVPGSGTGLRRWAGSSPRTAGRMPGRSHRRAGRVRQHRRGFPRRGELTVLSAARGSRPPPPIQSVARAAGLLQQLAVLGRPASLAELAAARGLERTTAWRLLTTLEACGLVDRDSSSDGFRVGFGTVAIASATLSDGEA